MSAIYGQLRAGIEGYFQTYPTEMPRKAAQSFIITGLIALAATSSTGIAILGGAIAATASVIEGLTRPIIRSIFPENPWVAQCIQICVPKLIALGGAELMAPWIGLTYRVTSVFIPLVAWLWFNQKFYENNTAMVEVL